MSAFCGAPPDGLGRQSATAAFDRNPADAISTEEQVDGIVAVLDDVRRRALPDVTVA